MPEQGREQNMVKHWLVLKIYSTLCNQNVTDLGQYEIVLAPVPLKKQHKQEASKENIAKSRRIFQLEQD